MKHTTLTSQSWWKKDMKLNKNNEKKYHLDHNLEPSYCYVNQERKYLFVDIPKNASTSIKKSVVFDEYIQYDSLERKNEYFKFLIFRNPLDRIISSFYEVRKCRKDGPYHITRNSPWYKEQNLFKSFRGFLDFITGNFYETHTFPQKVWLDHKNISFNVIDEILFVDTLKEDYTRMLKKNPRILLCTKRLMHSMKTLSKDYLPIKNFIETTPLVKRDILTLYQDDYNLYKNAIQNIKESREKPNEIK